METALAKVKAMLGKEYPLVIGEEEIRTDDKLKSINPSQPSEVVGLFSKANPDLANKAIETAAEKFEEWKWVAPKKRAEYPLQSRKVNASTETRIQRGNDLRSRKDMTGSRCDSAEAIDFLEFYAREMLRYSAKQPMTKIPGEKNELSIYSTWSWRRCAAMEFALAILTGMTSVAVVAGNTVVLKPSSDSPLTGWMFFNLMREVGLPVGVINFVTGSGACR